MLSSQAPVVLRVFFAFSPEVARQTPTCLDESGPFGFLPRGTQSAHVTQLESQLREWV